MKATYTSVWDCGTEITTECKYCEETNTVYNIEQSDTLPGGDVLLDEFVTLSSGLVLRDCEFEY